ncbi:efflux transporter outer membrane subunit [Alicycliphilus denitrificans]|uniref:Efflux transporter outer membrane subunit n=1 Tax=Alicycliphilus denitrificans TaxID=179636 RepID=A0A858ZNV6_9BURK|nr:efflux transporter outer membrane subunit [Alicycliphilus denitrificans]ADU98224.1 RND efflux system, outer membrane lipoprotein, NodT family [Alicycliphilus denitrificans BC]QKD42505.1 efflux transporter outer membrane subunit [Alicycliphilus denitrificans]GAO26137.1 RND efflux system, outer membrane lipoprotein, NodT family [Alicycliphilus sp. B1]
MHKHTLPRTRPARALSPLVIAALLAGCSFIPKYERPAAPVPEAFALAGNDVPATARAAADIDWKDYFTDPRLQRLIGIALGNNRDLRVAMLNVEQARAQFQIQRAGQFPTVNAIASGTRQPSIVNGQYANQFQAGLGISAWEIDFFGRIGALKEQALAQFLATEEARKSAQISLVAAVASGWLTLMADEELLDISRRTLETREESVKLTRLRLEHGVSSELDSHQAESLAQAARATYAQQQRQRLLDENALALLLGQPLPDDIRASLPSMRLADAAPMQPLPAGLPSDLLQRRPDIRQAEQLLIGANANIGAARAAFFPRISLTAQFGSVSDELSGLFKSGSWAFSLAPQLALPIFDAGRNQAGLESARAGREIAVAQYEKSIQTAFREVSDALAGQATLQQQIDAQRAQTQADAKRLDLSDLRYRNGVASYLDLLDAQRSLYATEQALVQTRLQQLQNQVTLYKVLGGGWTDTGGGPARS